MAMPTSGATPSQNPNITATRRAWPQRSLSPPSAIAVRKLSRLRVNPRMRRLPIIVASDGRDLPRLPAWQIRHRYSAVTYSGRAKANSALPWEDPSILGRKPSAQPPQPVGTRMYWRPSTLYEDGLLWWPVPHWNSNSLSPLLASQALNSPVGSPPKTTSPPVASSDEHMHIWAVQRQRS